LFFDAIYRFEKNVISRMKMLLPGLRMSIPVLKVHAPRLKMTAISSKPTPLPGNDPAQGEKSIRFKRLPTTFCPILDKAACFI
jgi:hypothetical protein